jgi:hypothetical protein
VASRWLGILVLALLPLAVVPLVGTSAAAVSALIVTLVACMLLARRIGWVSRPMWWTTAVAALGVLGGVVGAGSAVYALVAVGGTALYVQRVGMGFAALVLAAIAGVGSLIAGQKPVAGAAVVVVAGLAGAVAINLFYINTFYVLAVPFWLIAAVVALMGPSTPSR